MSWENKKYTTFFILEIRFQIIIFKKGYQLVICWYIAGFLYLYLQGSQFKASYFQAIHQSLNFTRASWNRYNRSVFKALWRFSYARFHWIRIHPWKNAKLFKGAIVIVLYIALFPLLIFLFYILLFLWVFLSFHYLTYLQWRSKPKLCICCALKNS